MKTRIFVLCIWAVFSTSSFALINDIENCQQYADFPMQVQVLTPYGLKISLADEYIGDVPDIDSVLISNRYGSTRKIYASVIAQWGDTLSLNQLIGSMESDYICWACINGCMVGKPFYFPGWCDEFKDVAISFTNINPHAIILHLEDTVSGIVPTVDSMWITTTAFRGFPEPLVSGKAKSGDTIDIAPLVGLQEIAYLCWLRIGDCVKSERFFFSGEEWDYCLEYADCYLWTDVTINVLQYSLTNTDQFENFHVDSVWVSSLYEPDVPLLVSYAQPEEDIILLELDRGEYLFSVQIDECIKRVQFYKHASAEHASIDTPDSSTSAIKILRDGQLLIERDGKIYTVTGQKVR